MNSTWQKLTARYTINEHDLRILTKRIGEDPHIEHMTSYALNYLSYKKFVALVYFSFLFVCKNNLDATGYYRVTTRSNNTVSQCHVKKYLYTRLHVIWKSHETNESVPLKSRCSYLFSISCLFVRTTCISHLACNRSIVT